MVREIVHSQLMLRMPSAPATPDDTALGQDLMDTLAAHAHECVGLAANMIGVRKRVIAVDEDGRALVMFNPELLETSDPYQTEEACLSLEGARPATRYQRIKVTWLDAAWHTHAQVFSGFTAQIIQHEIDHCNGVVI